MILEGSFLNGKMQIQEIYLRNMWRFPILVFLVVKMIMFLQYEAVLQLNPVQRTVCNWGGGWGVVAHHFFLIYIMQGILCMHSI